MVRVVDRALRLRPTVFPTLFVDDLAADIIAPEKSVVEELGGFIEVIAEFVESTDQELSPSKSLCTASTKELAMALVKRWRAKGIYIQWKKQVKALGVGLAAGRRRNVAVPKEKGLPSMREGCENPLSFVGREGRRIGSCEQA